MADAVVSVAAAAERCQALPPGSCEKPRVVELAALVACLRRKSKNLAFVDLVAAPTCAPCGAVADIADPMGQELRGGEASSEFHTQRTLAGELGLGAVAIGAEVVEGLRGVNAGDVVRATGFLQSFRRAAPREYYEPSLCLTSIEVTDAWSRTHAVYDCFQPR